MFGQDLFYSLETGRLHDKFFALAPFRWIAPQLWIFAAKDKGTLLRAYLAKDFTMINEKEVIMQPRLLAFMLLPALNKAGDKFYSLTARVRAARVLIRAEIHRMKHGEFPKTLPDLPPDPFTGKPLLYRVGETVISEMYWEKREAKTRVQTARAVQSWSIGPNRRDDGGQNSRKGDNVQDDIRAIILTP